MENGLRRDPFLPYLVLLRVGFAMRRALLLDRCALTAPFHPYLPLTRQAVYSLWHFPSSHSSAALKRTAEAPSRTLSGTLLCGVRTFLSLDRAARETPASTTQTATIRSGISYPYYKMNSGSKGPIPRRAVPEDCIYH